MNLKPRLITGLLLLTLSACGLATANAQQTKAEMHADSLFKNYKEDEALAAYTAILETQPRNLNALWRSSLLYSRVGHRYKDKDKQKKYYTKAKKKAEQALAVDSTDTQANFVMAAAMGRMALVLGSKQRVAASRDIKKYADRSIKADSSNAGAWHILGRWNYEISNLNFIERLAANTLFGGIPDGASSENAVRDIKKAISLNPDIIIYYRDLAKAYKDLGKGDQAIAACKNGLKLQAPTKEDAEIKNDCRKIIKKVQ